MQCHSTGIDPRANFVSNVMYIKDVPDRVKCIIKLFADDTKLLRKIRDDCDREDLQTNLTHLCEWRDNWQLSFNVPK